MSRCCIVAALLVWDIQASYTDNRDYSNIQASYTDHRDYSDVYRRTQSVFDSENTLERTDWVPLHHSEVLRHQYYPLPGDSDVGVAGLYTKQWQPLGSRYYTREHARTHRDTVSDQVYSHSDKVPVYSSEKVKVYSSERVPTYRSDKVPIYRSVKVPLYRNDKVPISRSDKVPKYSSDKVLASRYEKVPVYQPREQYHNTIEHRHGEYNEWVPVERRGTSTKGTSIRYQAPGYHTEDTSHYIQYPHIYGNMAAIEPEYLNLNSNSKNNERRTKDFALNNQQRNEAMSRYRKQNKMLQREKVVNQLQNILRLENMMNSHEDADAFNDLLRELENDIEVSKNTV